MKVLQNKIVTFNQKHYQKKCTKYLKKGKMKKKGKLAKLVNHRKKKEVKMMEK
jgi:hypothetical protein